MKSIYFLAIETSCDDTAIAVMRAIEKDGELRKIAATSNIVSSQADLHAGYGGVYPLLAKREHQKNLPLVFRKATEGLDISKLEFIAVTQGPGLDPCLWAGIKFAQALAKKYNLPLVGVNHLEAHFLANLVALKISEKEFVKDYLPAACLVVSGGHTLLFLASAIGNYKLLGQTMDDAAGECFDKAARILGLGYPGGAEIAKFAQQCNKFPEKNRGSQTSTIVPGDDREVKLPRPMMNQKNYNFSFSGLKTAVLYHYQKQPSQVACSEKYKIAMSREVQQAIIDVLVSKTVRAAKEFAAKSIIIGGGVSANLALRQAMEEAADNLKIKFLAPGADLSVDNAAMAGVAGYFAFRRGKKIESEKLISQPNLKI